MEDTGHVAGTTCVIEKGTHANIKRSYTNIKFTISGLTVASGYNVICIIIVAAKELTFEKRV